MGNSSAKPRHIAGGPVLVCKGVIYFSLNDEAAFFEWMKKLKCIKRIDGSGDELWIFLRSKNLSDRSLRDLIAMFYRYKIDMTQLQQFLNPSNAHWFNDKKLWFHKLVFSRSSR